MGPIPNNTDRVSPRPAAFTVAVIGGGIGGLCLAIGLLKHPHIDVQVFEAAPSFGEIGAGLTVEPNAQSALDFISPAAKAVFNKLATPNLWSSHANNFTENRCASSVFFTAYRGYGPREGEIIHAQKNRTGIQSVHRAKLLDGLVKLVPDKYCHFNKRLTHILQGNNNEKTTIHFKDGTSVQADAVIGADGVHSTVRLHILGDNHPAARAVFTGTGVHRNIVSMDKAIARVGAEMAQNSIMLCGPQRAIMSYPIDHGELLNVVAMEYNLGDKWEHNDWIIPASAEKLRDRFQGWGEAAQGMVDLISSSDFSFWALFDHPPAPYYNKGVVIVMGDAAHATTPFQAQGASQAMEDALVLEKLLGEVYNTANLPKAFAAYNQARIARSQRIVTTSRESGQLLGMMAPGVGDDLEKMAKQMSTRMHWVWNRDLDAQNKEALRLYRESL